MKSEIYNKKMLAMLLLSCALLLPKSVHAFIWPVVAPAEIGLFVENVVTALAAVEVDNKQIKKYIETIQAIGTQVSIVCKYAQDITDSINSIEDSVEQLDRMVNEDNEHIFGTIHITADSLNNTNNENNQMASNLVDIVEKAIK